MYETLRFYWQRLAPFIGVYVFFECIELLLLLTFGTAQPTEGDFRESLLSFINENAACLLFTILPYMMYLAVLPRDFHGGRWDKRATLVFFSIFCLIHWLEECVEIVSGDSFHLLTRDFIMAPAQAWQQLLELPYCEWMAGILFIELLITIFLLRKRLVTPCAVPHYLLRVITPCITAGFAFLLVYQAWAMDELADVPALYDDGLFHIFKWIYGLTAVPDLAQIFAMPCIYLGGILIFISMSYALLRQNFPQLRPWVKLPAYPRHLQTLLLAFLVCVLLARLMSLGIYPLMDTTEARYGEMARKMVETNNWLQPQFEYGVPFWGKPPLSFWCSAGTMLLCGINEWGARLAPYLATLGIGLCFLLWPFNGQRSEQRLACIIVLFTSAMGFVAAGAVMTDAFLALGTTLAMVSFYRAMRPEETTRRLWGYLFFLGLAIGLLSKGPLALVVCGLPIFAWVLWQRQWIQLWQRIPWITGTLLMLLLTLPWYIAAEQATPGFLRYFIIGEHFERFLVKGWAGDLYGKGHSRAIGTIWLYAVEMFLPWILLVPFLLRRNIFARISQPENAFLWCWALSTPLFFTMARNILPAYILPAVPAFCILLVRRLWTLHATQGRDYRQFIFAALPVLFIISMFGIGKGFNYIQYRCQQELLTRWDGHSPLYYSDNKVPYSAQFYSAGQARILEVEPEQLRHGDFLALHRSQYHRITRPDAWELLAEDGSWRLYRKR